VMTGDTGTSIKKKPCKKTIRKSHGGKGKVKKRGIALIPTVGARGNRWGAETGAWVNLRELVILSVSATGISARCWKGTEKDSVQVSWSVKKKKVKWRRRGINDGGEGSKNIEKKTGEIPRIKTLKNIIGKRNVESVQKNEYAKGSYLG